MAKNWLLKVQIRKYFFNKIGEIKIDWSLLDMINDQIIVEENVNNDKMDNTQQAGYTIVTFMKIIKNNI